MQWDWELDPNSHDPCRLDVWRPLFDIWGALQRCSQARPESSQALVGGLAVLEDGFWFRQV